MKIAELKNVKALPSTVREMDINKLRKRNELVEFTKASNLKPSDRKKVITLKNPSWVAMDTQTKDIYSYSASTDKYSKYKRGLTFLVYEFDKETQTLCLISSHELNNKSIKLEEQIENQEDNKMANNNNNLTPGDLLEGTASIDDMLNDIGASAAATDLGMDLGGAPTEMNTFGGEETQKELTDAEKAIENENKMIGGLKNALSEGVAIDAVKNLGDFNRRFGGVYGFVVNTAPAIKVTKTTDFVKDPVTKKFLLDDNATEDIKALYKAGNYKEIPKDYKKKIVKLVIKQAGPTALKGGVLGMPAGGFLSFTDVLDGNINIDESQKDVKKILLTKEELIHFVTSHFAGRAYDKTSDELKSIVVKATIDRKSATSNAPTKIRESLVPETKGEKLFTEKNFFPIKVYETLDVSKPLSAEDAAKANLSAFAGLFNANAKNGQIFDKLSAEYKAKVNADSVDGKLQITSQYFEQGKPAQWDETPKSWMDKSVGLHQVLLPVRTIKEGNEGKITYPWITYSAISTEALKGNDEYLAKTAFGLPEYAAVRESMGKVLSPAALKAITNTGKGTKSGKSGKPVVDTNLDLAAQFGILAKNYKNELDGSKFETFKSPMVSDSLIRRAEEAALR